MRGCDSPPVDDECLTIHEAPVGLADSVVPGGDVREQARLGVIRGVQVGHHWTVETARSSKRTSP